jgi:hypothetical protein
MKLAVDDFVEVEQFCVIGIGGFCRGTGGEHFRNAVGF